MWVSRALRYYCSFETQTMKPAESMNVVRVKVRVRVEEI